jgi:DNA-binding NtrC family response regulator
MDIIKTAELQPAKSQNVERRKKRVFIIDKRNVDSLALLYYSNQLGFEGQLISNAEEALIAMRFYRPQIIFLNERAVHPDQEIKLAEDFKRLNPDVIFIFVLEQTSVVLQKDLSETLENNVIDGIFVKPIHLSSLKDFLVRLIAKRPYRIDL